MAHMSVCASRYTSVELISSIAISLPAHDAAKYGSNPDHNSVTRAAVSNSIDIVFTVHLVFADQLVKEVRTLGLHNMFWNDVLAFVRLNDHTAAAFL